jgi:hypothetical protein
MSSAMVTDALHDVKLAGQVTHLAGQPEEKHATSGKREVLPVD